jgi:hypothetical protein
MCEMLVPGPIPLQPYLVELLRQGRTWAMQQQKQEPVTGPTCEALHVLAREAMSADASRGFLGQAAAIYDWGRLAMLTGSRLGEYGQSKLPVGAGVAAWVPIPDLLMFPWNGGASR